MKKYLFVFVVILLILGAGVVIAAPVSQDGVVYPMPATATIDAYPIVWPTVTAVSTQTPIPAIPKPDKPKPTKTPPPLPDGLPYTPQ